LGTKLLAVCQASQHHSPHLKWSFPPGKREQIEIDCKYEGYISRQEKEVEKNKSHSDQPIPSDFCFDSIPGLSNEAKQKLALIKPKNLGQAGRIPGMTPAAVSLLMVYLKKGDSIQNVQAD